MDDTLVIASIRSWDGVRILGAFLSEEQAVKECRKSGYDTDHIDFYLDVLSVGKISATQSLLVDGTKKPGASVRVHIYSEDNEIMNT